MSTLVVRMTNTVSSVFTSDVWTSDVFTGDVWTSDVWTSFFMLVRFLKKKLRFGSE